MGEYKSQEMAAVVCVYESGNFDVVSCHYTRHDAEDYLEFLVDEGYSKDWQGTLTVVCNGTVRVQVSLEKMLSAINRVRG